MNNKHIKTETFIGSCSNFVGGQGWTTKIPVSQIKDKGYEKITTIIELVDNMIGGKMIAQALREIYNID